LRVARWRAASFNHFESAIIAAVLASASTVAHAAKTAQNAAPLANSKIPMAQAVAARRNWRRSSR